MLEQLAIKAAAALSTVVPPKRAVSLSKYMYLSRLLAACQIEVVIDVGANVGQFAKSMRTLGFKGRIISFEPSSAQFKALEAASRDDPKWESYGFALGEQDAELKINIMASSVFNSFRTPSTDHTSMFQRHNTVIGTETVRVRRLADFAASMGIVDVLGRTFLKCDTQGFDMSVLKGLGSSLLRRTKMVQVETSLVKLYNDSPGMTEVIDYLAEHGISPVSLFPINRLSDWSALEMDYLGVNRALAS